MIVVAALHSRCMHLKNLVTLFCTLFLALQRIMREKTHLCYLNAIHPAITDQIKNLLCQGFLPDMKYAVRPAMVATRHTPGAVVDVFLSGITETGPRIAQGRVNGIVKGYFESGAPQFFQQSADVLSGNMWRKDHERMAVRHLGFQSRVRRSKYLVGGFPGAEK